MDRPLAKGVSVTFTPVFNGNFLFVQRQLNDTILPGYWGFPGGRVHAGETIAQAMQRECQEETGLNPTGKAFFVDSYLIGDRVGVHFALEVDSDQVALAELESHNWVDAVEHLQAFNPRIPGIDNHLHYIIQRLQSAGPTAWQQLDEFDLIKDRFLNH